ncbi:F-box-like/WD repeat-containing protein TBL1Y, partial [Zancudomyces culisetae]
FDGSVRVWDAASGTCLRTLQAHSDPIHSLAFSPDGRHLLTGSFDCRVRLWNLKSGSLSKSYLADDGIYDVEFSAHGNRIAACVANGTVVILAQ